MASTQAAALSREDDDASERHIAKEERGNSEGTCACRSQVTAMEDCMVGQSAVEQSTAWLGKAQLSRAQVLASKELG